VYRPPRRVDPSRVGRIMDAIMERGVFMVREIVEATGAPRYEVLAVIHVLEYLGIVERSAIPGVYIARLGRLKQLMEATRQWRSQ